MSETMRALSGNLYMLVSLYLLYRFARMMYLNGGQWVLKWFAISVMLIVFSIALQRGWAAAALMNAPTGQEYDYFFNNSRWLINSVTAFIFVVGAYMFEYQLMEVKQHFKQIVTYVVLIALAVFFSV